MALYQKNERRKSMSIEERTKTETIDEANEFEEKHYVFRFGSTDPFTKEEFEIATICIPADNEENAREKLERLLNNDVIAKICDLVGVISY